MDGIYNDDDDECAIHIKVTSAAEGGDHLMVSLPPLTAGWYRQEEFFLILPADPPPHPPL